MKLIDVIGGLLILAMVMPMLMNLMNMGFTKTQQRQAAEHLALVSRAAANYVRQHQSTLISQATPSSGPAVSVETMVNEGLLPVGFRDRNVWGQSYAVYIRKDAASGHLRAVVLTVDGRGHQEGSAFATTTVPGAAALLGASGGFVPTGDIPGQPAETLQGAGGGWSLSLGAVGIPSPGAGHLGALTSFDSAMLAQDFLYRVAVPGHPELNAMQTELDMTRHAIRNVSELQFEERDISSESCTTPDEQGRMFLDKVQGLYLCRNNSLEVIGDSGNSALLKNATVAKNGEKIVKPVCAPSTGTIPAIYTSPSIIEAGPQAPPMTAIQTWATSVSDTEWQVHARVQTPNKALGPDGWAYPDADYGRILVLTTCAKQSVAP